MAEDLIIIIISQSSYQLTQNKNTSGNNFQKENMFVDNNFSLIIICKHIFIYWIGGYFMYEQFKNKFAAKISDMVSYDILKEI